MRAKRIFVLTVAATALFVLFGATAVKDDALGTWVQPVEKPEYQPHPMMRDRSEW